MTPSRVVLLSCWHWRRWFAGQMASCWLLFRLLRIQYCRGSFLQTCIHRFRPKSAGQSHTKRQLLIGRIESSRSMQFGDRSIARQHDSLESTSRFYARGKCQSGVVLYEDSYCSKRTTRKAQRAIVWQQLERGTKTKHELPSKG